MPRKPLIKTNEYPYHITSRSNNREWFYLPLDEVWKIALDTINTAQTENGVIIHCFILMNNHYHLLISTPNSNIDKFQWRFASLFVRQIQKRTNRINHVLGCRYKSCIIDNKNYFHQVYKYIYLNSVRANIVKTAEEYKYSSLYYLIHKKENLIPFKVIDPFIGQDGYSSDEILYWINEGFTIEQSTSLKNGLNLQKTLELKDRNSRKIIKFSSP
ncbi:MAG: transposase [Oligoflexia bacterium]|nr:transposase [Oligoflexia bacterium]